MKEYWVNVYCNNILGFAYSNRDNAIEAAFVTYPSVYYRIHVKMKEPKRYRLNLEAIRKDNEHWMD